MTTKKSKADRRAAAAPINERALLTRQMAADYLSVAVSTFRRFEDSELIVGIPILSGKEKRYRRSDLDGLIEAIAEGRTKLQQAMKESA